jgi:ribosome biogenesis SPOUT family RNA methylase Rps3
MSPKKYVVEHMEPEMGPWSTLEYAAIAAETAAAGSVFYLSSLQPQLAAGLPATLRPLLGDAFVATTEDVETISDVPKEKVCLLDPQATETLAPQDAERFEWFVFGGILGR